MIIFSKGWSIDKDGPGQRLIFYLKGCNMSCLWCANPESISPEKQLLFYPDRSKNNVDYVCPYNAVKGKKLDRKKCLSCRTYDCIKKWKNRCFELVGEEISPEEVLKTALEAKEMFGKNGGVTFGGGEPLLQIEELVKTICLLRKNKIHTVVETNASTPGFKKLVNTVDYMICDFKAFTADIHKKMTGLSNKTVLGNLLYAAKKQTDLLIRIPLVTNFNTDKDELQKMLDFLLKLKLARKKSIDKNLSVELLRMHHLGMPKYAALGIEYRMKNVKETEMAILNSFREMLLNSGIKVGFHP